MKVLGFIFILLPTIALANKFNLESKCYMEEDKLDRDYCHGKRMKMFQKELDSDRSTWKKKLNQKAKDDKMKRLKMTISQKESHIKMLQDEISKLKGHQDQLTKAKVVKKKKKKKKKKDNNDLNKALKGLGIKL